ncbi:MerR family DNA-binding transcriptional regulator [Streptomyces sp. 110]|uniref:MerR family DNA-binding transcriptional regulator n=1 Tax=Streptomyces endocoffeicus TaxID=2898945 RepID=A0ABS1Q9X9_9ACTN|nr:MerR family DNA-binding transcriptional regulator [Streptomyces endocoffeicus]
MRIGAVADKAGVSVRALRYHEEQDLLQAFRSPGGHRAVSGFTPSGRGNGRGLPGAVRGRPAQRGACFHSGPEGL